MSIKTSSEVVFSSPPNDICTLLSFQGSFRSHPLEDGRLITSSWLPESISSFLANHFPHGNSTLLRPLDANSRIICRQQNAFGPISVLAHFSNNACFLQVDPRWASAIPNLHYSTRGVYIRPFSEDQELYICLAGFLIIPYVSSLSHFFAEVFPQVCLGLESADVKGLFILGSEPWQASLIKDLSCAAGKPVIFSSVFSNKQGVLKVIQAENCFWIDPLPFYLGIDLSVGYLHTFWSKTNYTQIIRSESEISGRRIFNGRSRRVYLTRYRHDHKFNSHSSARSHNCHELIKWAVSKGFDIICPENYCFWSIYRAIENADFVVADNGSSQTHALINHSFAQSLQHAAVFRPLFSPRIISTEPMPWHESLLWYYSIMGFKGFQPWQKGQTIIASSHTPFADQVSYQNPFLA